MNKLVCGTPSTFSRVLVTTVLAGTMSLTFQPQLNQNLFQEGLHSPHYTSGLEGTCNPYPIRRSEKATVVNELKHLVDRVIESQVAPDIEFDIIIANNIRSLYQYGFTE